LPIRARARGARESEPRRRRFIFGEFVLLCSTAAVAAASSRPGTHLGTGETSQVPRKAARRPNRRRMIAGVNPEGCSRYMLTVDEFLSWQSSIDQHGLAGLRTTRI